VSDHLTVDTGEQRVGTVDVLAGAAPQGCRAVPVRLLAEPGGVLASRPRASSIEASLPDDVTEDLRAGCRVIGHAFGAAAGATAGVQAAEAVASLRLPWAGAALPCAASTVLGTAAGEDMLEAMRRDPTGCGEAYNAAAAAVPAAGIRPLRTGADPELPLWVLQDGERKPAFRSSLDGHALMPRALVTTALARHALADAFIHGTGGGVYDRVMERWIGDWLGWSLAPMGVVSATVHLPDCDPLAVERARQAVRRQAHDPGSGGGGGPSEEKMKLLQAVNRAPRGSAARAEAFAALQAWRAAPEGQAVATESLAVAARRDWAFPLYPVAAMEQLAREIRRGVTATGVPRPSTSM